MRNFWLIPKVRKQKKEKSSLQEWVESIVIAFFLAMFIRTFFFQAFRIPSGSMEHTLEIGDRLLVNKLQYGAMLPFTHYRLPGFTKPQRGDVVVFKYPKEPRKDFIKRLIAFGGETVQIKYGDVYINGQLIEDPAIKNVFYYNRGDFNDSEFMLTIPRGQVFVLGDNSASSHDSRYWGCLPEWMVIGQAQVIYWPLNRMRFIK
jgi:signal peptidase I